MQQSQDKSVTTPTSIITSMYFGRLGKIFSNISVVCLVFSLATIVSFLLTATVWLIGILLIILSVGAIFAIFPDYISTLTQGQEIVTTIATALNASVPFLMTIGIIGAVASIILLILDRRERHTGRIAFSAVILIGIVIVLFVIVGGSK